MTDDGHADKARCQQEITGTRNKIQIFIRKAEIPSDIHTAIALLALGVEYLFIHKVQRTNAMVTVLETCSSTWETCMKHLDKAIERTWR